MRVRVGPLTAEGPRDELERLGLRRGEPASASFSPADARLIVLSARRTDSITNIAVNRCPSLRALTVSKARR